MNFPYPLLYKFNYTNASPPVNEVKCTISRRKPTIGLILHIDTAAGKANHSVLTAGKRSLTE